MSLSRYYTLPNLYTLINLLVLSFVVYCGVDVFYTLAGSDLVEVKTEQIKTEYKKKSPAPGKRRSPDYYLSAINRGLFGNAKETAAKPEGVDPENLEPTALKIALLGTVSGDKKTAAAIIQDKAKRSQSLYKEGDTVQNATIVTILRGKVVLRVGDENQILTMEENPTASSSTRRPSSRRPPRDAARSESRETKITLHQSTISKSLENFTELLSQVRVRPHYKGGQADGLLLSQVKPNTLFTRLGLRNGDVIQSVDGEEIESPDDILDFYEELKSGSSVSLELMRRGKKKTMRYSFK
jgi:general secretion pathway protein C